MARSVNLPGAAYPAGPVWLRQNKIFFATMCVLALLQQTSAVILTPPYFNLAKGRRITASATCGEDTGGPERYCKLGSANLIQGLSCDYCDPTRPDKMHPPEFAVDDDLETWWQSPTLNRRMKCNEVNLTIDLGQEFHVAYVYIKMGNSPRPDLWVLEKSSDYGKTFTPWQYFSDSTADCETYFGKESLEPISRDDSVICSREYSKILPLEGGEIPISLLSNRPSASMYFNSSVLQEWTRATNVRLRFLRTKNLLKYVMRQDPTVDRCPQLFSRLKENTSDQAIPSPLYLKFIMAIMKANLNYNFYSIKDINIEGRCMCNGHADTCDIQDPQDPKKLLCRCQHHTCGPQCAQYCPGFEQKTEFIPATTASTLFEHERELTRMPEEMIPEAIPVTTVVNTSYSDNTGTFFGENGGHVKLKDSFHVGVAINIQMDIKPRNVSGLLMSVHGKKDYLVLQIVDGVIIFKVNNGKGPMITAFKPTDNKYYLCDGNWHSIQAIKSKNVVNLSVDKTFAGAGVGMSHKPTTDTRYGLFLGGHQLFKQNKKIRGVEVHNSFVGCIRNLHINNKPVNIEPAMAQGDVSVGVCQTN